MTTGAHTQRDACERMKYYRRNPGDYLSATRHLTMIQHGAYNVLMDTYYATEDALPADPRALYRIAGAQTAAERAAVDFVAGQFFVREGDVLVQGRIETEIANGREKASKLSANGHAGAEARARNLQAKAQANAQAIAKQLPRHIHQPSDSVPNGTGAEPAPPKSVDKIFAFGVPLLTAAGISDRNARSMLGLMRKQHGDDAVSSALDRCAEERPLEPVAWLQAALKVETSKANGRERGPDWWASNEGIQRKAAELGVEAKPGESYNDLKQRVSAVLERRH